MLCFIIDDKNLESDFAFSKVFVNEKEGGGGGKKKGMHQQNVIWK